MIFRGLKGDRGDRGSKGEPGFVSRPFLDKRGFKGAVGDFGEKV